ncbi:MAG TPA: SxtJ family membrane protein [Candidatus Omnitrophota bacterium]|nr:SxtJ family membrane protein [Candidatus Omnitrophota bacterium]
MSWIEEFKKIKSGPKELREFGLTVGSVLVLLGLLFWWRGKTFFLPVLAVGAVLFISGIAVPKILRPLQKIWMGIALVLGSVMTRVILTAVFCLVLTPIGLLIRLSGKDLLDLKRTDGALTYWRRREKGPLKEDYEKQF